MILLSARLNIDCAPDTTFNLTKLTVKNRVLLLNPLKHPGVIMIKFPFTAIKKVLGIKEGITKTTLS